MDGTNADNGGSAGHIFLKVIMTAIFFDPKSVKRVNHSFPKKGDCVI